jgi:hypothetical protein
MSCFRTSSTSTLYTVSEVTRAGRLDTVTCCLGNVTNSSWNACLTVGFIWPFLGRATTIHFTNLLHTNKNLVSFSSGVLALTKLSVLKVLFAGLFLSLTGAELF